MLKRNAKKQHNNQDEIMNVNHNKYQCPVPVPQVVNVDDIAVFSDEELYARLTSMESDRTKVVESRFDPMLWEVEIAYLRREMGIRRQRREAHEAYMKDNAHLVTEEDVIVDFDDTSVVLN